MVTQRDKSLSRREFLNGVTLAGAATILGWPTEALAAEPPPETTRIRLVATFPSICRAPQYLAEEFLLGEGFTDVQYIKVKDSEGGADRLLASGQADITMQFVGPSIIQVDAGDPLIFLAGNLVACFELFGTHRIRTIRDLKGKTVYADVPGSSARTFFASMIAYVGLDPRTDINWFMTPGADRIKLLSEGKIDALMALPPLAQELRAKKIGHVVVNTMMDRPWSQYFCCLVTANREFVRKHRVATKRALRAILKATDVFAREPERMARFLVDKGYTERHDYALQALKEMPYDKWREYDPEDTIRFHALRMNETGMIKSSPQKIISQGTDWRFLRELKKELKA
ncbi:MAG TPA: ABC transporter substrate-binding protein [Candidatus Binatia bacterium]|jgi:NitT/TauT family transport system substrate-binding protein